MDDSIWGNLFSADDPMAPQLEFRGGNGHTGKSIIIRSGTEPKPLTQILAIPGLTASKSLRKYLTQFSTCSTTHTEL